jgi:hypothetical protein
MSTSTHQVARFDDGEEKFVLVTVDSKWAKEYGEKAVQDSLTAHPKMTDHGLPILIAHVEGDQVTYFGAAKLVDEVAAFGWSNIEWEEEQIELEWEDDDDDEESEGEEEEEEK